MSTVLGPTGRWLYRQLPGVVALALVIGVFSVARLPQDAPEQKAALAASFGFEPRSIALPGGLPQQEIRKVNQRYTDIDAWISSVGAGISMNDIDGDGLANDLCVTDPRTDTISVTPTPDARANRYAPFTVSYGSLPMNAAMAPMGCTPADLNQDGRMDLLLTFWGRTPIIALGGVGAGPLTPRSFTATELVPGVGDTVYTGPQWNTNAVAVSDFDGDGRTDLYVGNYFPDGPVLDPNANGGVEMNDSLSNASNGGEDHVFCLSGVAPGGVPQFMEAKGAIPDDLSRGWVLGSSATDLDGDQLPELYLAQDHGVDGLLHNVSTPGHIAFRQVSKAIDPLTPKSKTLGHDSFKGMAVDFADLDGNGLFDMFVSNITTSWGIEESNLQWMNTATDRSQLRAELSQGNAPYVDRSTQDGTAWSGWAWDVKIADFTNSGDLSIAQATGFVKGETNRWPQLQELATSNDLTVRHPEWWPHVRQGDDIAGNQRLKFYVEKPDGTYVDLAPELGLDVPVPTRGIATGDSDGDGRVDMAVARQWDQPVFYHNTAPAPGSYLTLNLEHADTPGSPVVGAEATVCLADGRTLVQQVDGGSGHTGKRSNEIHLGLGHEVTGPVQVHLRWRDHQGRVHDQDVALAPGRHTIALGATATEAPGRAATEDKR